MILVVLISIIIHKFFDRPFHIFAIHHVDLILAAGSRNICHYLNSVFIDIKFSILEIFVDETMKFLLVDQS